MKKLIFLFVLFPVLIFGQSGNYDNIHFSGLVPSVTTNKAYANPAHHFYWNGVRMDTIYPETDPYSFHKADSNTVKNAITLTYLNSQLTLKANISDSLKRVYDSLTNIYTQGQVDGLLGAKQNVSDTSAKDATRYWVGLQGFLTAFSETDPVWLSDSSGYYKKTTVDNRFAPISHTQAISTVTSLQDSLMAHYTKTQIDNFFSGAVVESGYNKSTWDALVTFPGFGTSHSTVPYGDTVAVHNTRLKKLEGDSTDWNTAYGWGQWHDTLVTRIYQGTGILVTGSAPSYTIKADTALVETKALATSQLATKLNRLNAISDGYVPYQSASAHAFVNSPFYTDGTNVSIGTPTIDKLLSLYGANAKIRLQHNAYDLGELGLEFSHRLTGADYTKAAIVSVADNILQYGRSDLCFVLNDVAGANNYDKSTDTKLFIKNNGQIGIRTITPTTGYMLDVNAIDGGAYIHTASAVAGTHYGINIQATGAATTNIAGYFNATGATNNYGLIVENGNVGIGTVAPYYKGDIAGDFRVQGTYSLGLGGTTGAYTDRFYSPSSGIISTGSQLQSTLATGTPPLAVTSTTVNANLNAGLLDGQHGTYWRDYRWISTNQEYGSDDLNDCINGGIGIWGVTTLNRPSGIQYGTILNFVGAGGVDYNGVNNWLNQIAIATGGEMFTRTKINADAWGGWSHHWTDVNDGTGSGLDADLLDGHHWADVPVITGKVNIADSNKTITGNYVTRKRLDSIAALKRNLNNHDSLSTLDEKSYNSLTDKPTIPTIGGSNTQVQYNNSGAFAGSVDFVWNNTNKALTVNTTDPLIMGTSPNDGVKVFEAPGNGIVRMGVYGSDGIGSFITFDSWGSSNGAEKMTLSSDSIKALGIYTTTVGATNKPLFVDNTGLTGTQTPYTINDSITLWHGMHKYQSDVFLGDDQIITLPGGIWGNGTISANYGDTFASFHFNCASIVTLHSISTSDVASTDTDGKLCVYSGGSGYVKIKNRLGFATYLLIDINYSVDYCY